MDHKQVIKELTIMLLHLTSWRENGFQGVSRSWKGYDFDILNELKDDGLISGSNKSKSVYLLDDCTNMAKLLLKKYGVEPIEDDENA